MLRISFLILLLTGILNGQQQTTTSFELFGKVKSLQSVTRPVSEPYKTTTSGFLDSKNFDSIYLEFDRNRNLILRENYLDYRGHLGIFDRTIYKINPSNQIEKLETLLIQNGEEPSKVSQLKKFYYIGNQLARKDEYNYGKTNNQLWIVNHVYKYGLLSEKVFWMEDRIFSRTEYEYDMSQNLLSEKDYHNNNKLGKSVIYENNRYGQPVKIITYAGNEEEIKTFEYNEFYHIKTDLKDKTGKSLLTETFGNDGRIVEIRKFNFSNNSFDVFTFEYETDLQNNWVICNIYRNSHLEYIIERKIIYFSNL